MSNKRILLITRPISPPWDEASKNFVFSLIQNIREFKLDVLVKDVSSEIPNNINQNRTYTSSEISGFNFFQKMRALIFQFKNRGKFDVVHYFFTPAKLNVFVIRNFLLKSKTKTVQTVATLREDLYSDEDIKKMLFADQIITYSDYSKEKLKKLGVQNVKRIYPGIDLQKYQRGPKHLATLAMFNLKSDDFIITFPGEYTRLGSVDEVVESFQEIEKKIPEARLVLACRVKNQKDLLKKEEILKKIVGTNIEKKVVFTDTFSDMPKLYNLSDIILFPVHNMHGKFDVPLVIPEAQASEKPVIVSDLPVFREFALPDNSVTIKKESASEIIRAILDLYANPEKRAELGRNGRKFVEENFDIKKIAKEYEKIYEQI